jgi:hypothetical protein
MRHGEVLPEPDELTLHQGGRARVERGARLVEEDHRGVGCEHPRDAVPSSWTPSLQTGRGAVNVRALELSLW